MRKGVLTLFCISFYLLSTSSFAQDDPMVVGFQFRPIFKNNFFNFGNAEVTQNNVNFVIAPKLGFTWGMVVRQPLAKKVSFEFGINYVKRKYLLGVDDLDSSFSTTGEFAIVEYEIPLSVLVHVRLGDRLFMNNAGGFSINMFKRSEQEIIDDIDYSLFRKSWINFGMNANVGFEYRTKSAGYFYMGGSYQLPFTKVSLSADYLKNVGIEQFDTKLNLGYFTVDLKYYFPSRQD